MKINIEVLRAALNELLDHARDMHGESIEVEGGLYWFVQKEVLRNPERKPTELTLGSLEDEWSEILAIGVGVKDPFGYGLVWASSVLRAIGDRTP